MKQHHRGVVALGGAAVAAAALVATSAQAAPAPPVDGTYVVPFQYTELRRHDNEHLRR
jgi:hypothetical protein